MLFALLFALLLPANAAPAAAAESRTLVGEILSVDVANREVVVVQGLKAADKRGAKERETITVHVPFTTRVVRGTKAATLSELRPRDHAVVRYRVTGSRAEALSLQVADLATPTPAPGS